MHEGDCGKGGTAPPPSGLDRSQAVAQTNESIRLATGTLWQATPLPPPSSKPPTAYLLCTSHPMAILVPHPDARNAQRIPSSPPRAMAAKDVEARIAAPLALQGHRHPSLGPGRGQFEKAEKLPGPPACWPWPPRGRSIPKGAPYSESARASPRRALRPLILPCAGVRRQWSERLGWPASARLRRSQRCLATARHSKNWTPLSRRPVGLGSDSADD